jgi:nucleoside-diphosphate-sugar epimerase
MKVLVTGASGFIGSTLIGELDTLGFEVFALMRKTSKTTNLEGLKFQRVEGDLSDYESLCRAVEGVDYVFHLAGVTRAKSKRVFFEENVKGTERIARAIQDVRPSLTRMVYISSLAAGGPSHSLRPKIESDRAHPVSSYGASKLQAEKELLRFKCEFPLAIVRPPIVYGPKDQAIFLMVKTIARNLMPILHGSNRSGHKYYSAIHAKDLCRGLVQIALAPKDAIASGEVFYLAGDGIHTYQEWVSAIAEKLNCEPLRLGIPNFLMKTVARAMGTAELLSPRPFVLNVDKLRELLPDYWICSNQKAKTMVGFVPEFDLVAGLEDTIDWYKKQRWI